jgi:hypothetical protein
MDAGSGGSRSRPYFTSAEAAADIDAKYQPGRLETRVHDPVAVQPNREDS